MRLPVTDSLINYLKTRPEGLPEIVARAGQGKDSIYRASIGKVKVLSDANTEALARGLGITVDELANIALAPVQTAGKEAPSVHSEPSIREISELRRIHVYGISNALATERGVIMGDIIPENESSLPVIYTTEKKAVGAFVIDGQSMEPKILDGDIAVCVKIDDPQSLTKGAIVMAKFDDTVVCKQYRRYGDTIILESANPSGKTFEIHASEIEWMLKVTKIERTI